MQYAVLLAAGERPVGVIEVATGEAYVGARFLDGELAIASEADCRVPAPGRLFILEQRAGRAERVGRRVLPGADRPRGRR